MGYSNGVSNNVTVGVIGKRNCKGARRGEGISAQVDKYAVILPLINCDCPEDFTAKGDYVLGIGCPVGRRGPSCGYVVESGGWDVICPGGGIGASACR